MKQRAFLHMALICSLLTSAGTASVSAAAAPPEPQAVQIVFNGEVLSSDAEPFISKGTTMIPFRVLFEKLGIAVGWDSASRSVTGRSDDVTIELRAGETTAIVNGEERELIEAPQIVRGRTYVPLRFVSESVAAQVTWNQQSRTVTVVTASSQPSEAEADRVKAVYEAYVEAANKEELSTLEHLLHADSPLIPAVKFALADSYGRRDVETVIDSLRIRELSERTAVLHVTESNYWLDGAYYLDNRVEMKVTMHKDSRGEWKIYDAETLSHEWLVPFAMPGKGGSEADESAAEHILANFMEALNQEDLAGAMEWVHRDAPQRKATEETLTWMFSTYDLEHTLEYVRVLESSEDEMYVYTVQSMHKKSGPALSDIRLESIHTLRNQPGEGWKLYSTVRGETQVLSIPQ